MVTHGESMLYYVIRGVEFISVHPKKMTDCGFQRKACNILCEFRGQYGSHPPDKSLGAF